MRNLIRYPALSNLDCSECQKHTYSIPDCELTTFNMNDGKGDQPSPRPSPPPCEVCPKGGPENNESFRLNRRNEKSLRLYYLLQGPGFEVPEHLRGCTLFADNYSTIDGIITDARAEKHTQSLAIELATVLIRR